MLSNVTMVNKMFLCYKHRFYVCLAKQAHQFTTPLWFTTKHNVGFVCSLQCLEAELLKHLAERREHEREVAQKALTKEHQEHRVHAHHEQRHMLLNASQEEEVSLIPKPDPKLCQGPGPGH